MHPFIGLTPVFSAITQLSGSSWASLLVCHNVVTCQLMLCCVPPDFAVPTQVWLCCVQDARVSREGHCGAHGPGGGRLPRPQDQRKHTHAFCVLARWVVLAGHAVKLFRPQACMW